MLQVAGWRAIHKAAFEAAQDEVAQIQNASFEAALDEAAEVTHSKSQSILH